MHFQHVKTFLRLLPVATVGGILISVVTLTDHLWDKLCEQFTDFSESYLEHITSSKTVLAKCYTEASFTHAVYYSSAVVQGGTRRGKEVTCYQMNTSLLRTTIHQTLNKQIVEVLVFLCNSSVLQYWQWLLSTWNRYTACSVYDMHLHAESISMQTCNNNKNCIVMITTHCML